MLEHLTEVAVVIAMAISPSLLGNVIRLKYGMYDPPYPRELDMIGQFMHALAVVLVLLYIGLNQPSGLASLGIALTDVSSAESLLPGVFGLYFAVVFPLLLSAWFRHLTRKEKRVPRSTREMMSRYNTPQQRFGLMLLLPFIGIQEEVLFRGYLVLLVGERTGAVLPCAIVSILLFVTGHLYQGREAIPFHLWFALLTTGVTLWTGSIFWTVGAHALLNFVIVLQAQVHAENEEYKLTTGAGTSNEKRADQPRPQVEG